MRSALFLLGAFHSRSRFAPIAPFAMFALLGLGAAPAARAETITWTGASSSSWHTPGNWDLNRVPGAGDDVVLPDVAGSSQVDFSTGTTSVRSIDCDEPFAISAGTLTIDVSVVFQGPFTQSGGILDGGASVVVSDLFNWTGGRQEGSGTTTVEQDWTISAGIDLRGSRKLINEQTCTWTGGTIQIQGGGAEFENSPGAIFRAQSDATLITFFGSGVFDNQAGAVFEKSSSTGTTVLHVGSFLNSGLIDIKTGTLQLLGGSLTSPATLQSAPGTTFSGNVDVTFGAGATLDLGGNLAVTAGVFTIAPTCVFTLDGALALSGGSLFLEQNLTVGSYTQTAGVLNGVGSLVVSDSFTWTGGRQDGSGVTTVEPDWTISAGLDMRETRKLINEQTCTWTGGTIQIQGGGAEFENSPGAIFRAQCDATMITFFGSGVFDNQAGAIFEKSSSTGQTELQVGSFLNAGLIDIKTGTLQLLGGALTSPATLQSAPGTTFSGNVDVTFGAGATLDLGGNLAVTAGVFTIAPTCAFTLDGALALAGGSLFLEQNLTVGSYTQTAGVLNGAGSLVVSDSFVWTGGTQEGSGVTTVEPNWTISAGIDMRGPRKLINQQTCTWTGGTIQIQGSGAEFENAPGAIFRAQCDATLITFFGTGVFDNQAGAVFEKSSSTGTTVLHVGSVLNSGLIDIKTGTLQLSGGALTSPATLQSAPGTTFSSNVTVTFEAGATLDLGGNLSVTAGVFTIAPTCVFTLDGALALTGGSLFLEQNLTVGSYTQTSGVLNGVGSLVVSDSFVWTGGTQAGSGVTTVEPNWTISAGIDMRGPRKLINQQTCTWAGGTIQIQGGGAEFENAPDAIFRAQCDATMITFFGTGVFDNQAGATFEKSSSSGETSVNVTSFTNSGVVRTASGTVRFVASPTNRVGNTLTGGEWIVESTLQMGTTPLTTNEATIVLDGSASQFTTLDGADALSAFAMNAAGASFTLLGDRDLTTSASFTNQGLMLLGDGPSVFTANSGYLQTAGETRLEGGAVASTNGVDLLGGLLTGNGAVTGDLENASLVAPGTSPGRIDVDGDYSQSAGGALHIDLAGVSPGDGFDLLAVSGVASLGGALELELSDGFVPAPETSFDFLTAASFVGVFASDNLPLAYVDGCLEGIYLPQSVRALSHQAPGFLEEPTSQESCIGGSVTFSAVVSGSGDIEMQWFKDGGPIEGATSASLSINPVVFEDEGVYSLHLSSACGDDSSIEATLTVRTPAVVTSDPVGVEVCEGDDVILSVTASGDPAPTFQWRQGTIPITGATDPTLTLSNVDGGDAGSYDCVVSNLCATVTSEVAAVVVRPTTQIVTPPAAATVCVGEFVEFSVVATGDALSFQWRKDEVDIDGEVTATFAIASVVPEDTGAYDVVVSGTCGIVTSTAAPLTVEVCGEPLGACCLLDGSCVVSNEAECLAAGGIFQGTLAPTGGSPGAGELSDVAQRGATTRGALCDPNPCPQPELTGACCFADGSCLVLTSSECEGSAEPESGGVYQGDGTVCEPNSCPQPEVLGACCFTDGSCSVVTEAACAETGDGAYQGDDTDCDPNACPQPEALGACCFADGSCSVVTEATCAESADGAYQGDDTVCDPNPCPQPELLGACCFADGSCSVVTEATCAESADGAYQGDDTVCDPNSCPQPDALGACCFADGECSIATELACSDGAYQGDDTVCDPNSCPQPEAIGACCFGLGFCNQLTEAACFDIAGVYQGDETACDLNPCAPPPPTTGACCFRLGNMCRVLTPEQCASGRGGFRGLGTVCEPNPCGQNATANGPESVGACCLEDGTCVVADPGDCADTRGAFGGVGVGCDGAQCGGAAERTTWGAIKKRYN